MLSKIFQLLDSKSKKKFKFIIFLNFFIFFLEFLSLVSVPTFVSIIINPELFIEKVNNFISNEYIYQISNEKLLVFGAIFVIGSFILKNVFLIFLTYVQGNFFKIIKAELANKLFSHYVNSDYFFHLKSNPATLSRNVSHEIQGVYTYIFHLIALIRESLAVLVIISLLLFLNPFVTLSICLFLGLLAFVYIKKIKPSIKNKSIQNQNLIKSISQTVFETFGAIKDLKILLKEKQILKFFNDKIKVFENNLYYFSFYERFPRILLELFSIIGITIVSLLYLNFNPNFLELLPVLALLVVSIVRFIPAFSAITLSITYMKIFEPSVQLLNKELVQIDMANIKERKIKIINKKINVNFKNNFFSLDNISFSYPESKIFPIKNVSINIEEASKVGITGKTGAGKSTMFHLMLGLLTPNKGNIFYKGESIFDDLKKWRKEVGYISQNVYLLDSSIKRNIAFNFLDEPIDIKKLEKAISISNLSKKISDLPNGIETKVGAYGLKLSGGERQRIALARAIYREPRIFFMDESTSSLDTKTEGTIMQNMKNNFKDKTMIIIAHRKSTIEMCDKVLILENGSIKQT